jgi:hypothetical protein
LGNDLAKPAVS